MSDLNREQGLKSRLLRLWNAPVERPAPVIALVPPGRDPGDMLRQVTQELNIQLVRIHLNQVVPPDQHALLMQGNPRLVAISGLETLSVSERDAFVRLLYSGARTLPVTWCSVDDDQRRRVSRAWEAMRTIESGERRRAERLAASSATAA